MPRPPWRLTLRHRWPPTAAQLLLSSDNARAFFKYYPTNFDPNSCDAADAAGDVVLLSASDRSQCDLKEVMKENASLRWAVALLVGAVLTSRSPASAISIVGEMRANGDFTKTVRRAAPRRAASFLTPRRSQPRCATLPLTLTLVAP